MPKQFKDSIKVDKNKFKYTVYYYPGSGGNIFAWLLGLAHEPRLINTALECFPMVLQSDTRTLIDDAGNMLSGWCLYENVQSLNPYAKAVFLNVNFKDSQITDLNGTMGSLNGLNSLMKLTELSSKHSKNIFLTMSPKSRMRACYEKGCRPWRSTDHRTCRSIINEMLAHNMYQNTILTEFKGIDYFLDYTDLYTGAYLKKIEQITKQPATDSSIESMETLVNRYIQLTPPKLLTKIKAELNIYNSKDYNSINL